jgi:hypothetical protein
MRIGNRMQLIALLFFVLAVLMVLFISRNEGDSQKMFQSIRTMSAYLFYGYLSLALATFLFAVKAFIFDLKKVESKIRLQAQWVANRNWYIKEVLICSDAIDKKLDLSGWREERHNNGMDFGSAILKLSSEDINRYPLILLIRPGHPSINDLEYLEYLDIVGFEIVNPLDCALNNELCAHLVLAKDKNKA